MKTGEANGPDYKSLAEFRAALRRFLAFSEAATRAAGVTPLQYQALLAIHSRREQAMVIRDLAEEMVLQHHGAVQLVDRLARAKLIERRHPCEDRRTVLVALTAKGKTLLAHLAAAHQAELLKQQPLLAESLKRLRQIDR